MRQVFPTLLRKLVLARNQRKADQVLVNELQRFKRF